jgi:Domain of unknown function (DUF5666)
MAASRSRWLFIPLVVALLFVGVASVAYALGVASGGSPTTLAAQASTIPGHPELGPGWTSPSTPGGSTGQETITITKIDGNQLSLQTADGWTRTIDATGATIAKGGQTIAVTGLKVGDQITFREARQSDGTYKITAISVVSPTAPGTATGVQGTVASKTDSTIVVTTTAGKTVTVDVSATTRYVVRGVTAPTLASIAVGSRISAQGTFNADGSLNASVVQAFAGGQPGFGGSGGYGGSGGRGFGGGSGGSGGSGGRGFGGRGGSASPRPSSAPSGATT